MKVSQALSEKIQNIIHEYVSNPAPLIVRGDKSFKKHNLREIADKLNFLPATFDWFDCWGIQPNGKIILVSFDQISKFKTEKNQKILNMVLFETANTFPQLIELKPIRSKDSILCPGCSGTGILLEFAHNELLAKSIRCNCGGVGWLPSSDDKYLFF